MNTTGKKPILSVVVPTIKYTNLLDETIESALALRCSSLEIVVNCNPWSDEFLKSKYSQHPIVRWEKITGPRLAIADSFNDAVNKSAGNWILILADDDLVDANLLENVDLDTLSKDTLVTFGLKVTNLDGEKIGEGNFHRSGIMSQTEAVEALCRFAFWHHLSLFLFSKKLWDQVGGFTPMGFPNGYYEDTVHHAKLINAASGGVQANKNIMFVRRISTEQASARFYKDPRIIVGGLSNVAKELCKLSLVGPELQKMHGGIAGFHKFLIKQRLSIDLMKLQTHYKATSFACLQHVFAARSWGLSPNELLRVWIDQSPGGIAATCFYLADRIYSKIRIFLGRVRRLLFNPAR